MYEHLWQCSKKKPIVAEYCWMVCLLLFSHTWLLCDLCFGVQSCALGRAEILRGKCNDLNFVRYLEEMVFCSERTRLYNSPENNAIKKLLHSELLFLWDKGVVWNLSVDIISNTCFGQNNLVWELDAMGLAREWCSQENQDIISAEQEVCPQLAWLSAGVLAWYIHSSRISKTSKSSGSCPLGG